jgi:hypothetical protein
MFSYLQEGKTIEAEIKVEEKNGYQHHEIVQLFENGQPVAIQQKQGGGFRGRSPEEAVAQNKSIEEQTAFKGGVELIIAGKASLPVAASVENWLLTKLGGEISKQKTFPYTPDKPHDTKPAEKPPVVVANDSPAEKYGYVDKVYLDEALKDPNVKKSFPATKMMEWLRAHNAGATGIPAGAAKLNKEDAEAFRKEIEERRAMA